jgi:hypothetical protein
VKERETKQMLSIAEIKQFIDDDIASEKKTKAKIGQKYYEAEHDILKYRLFYWNADGKFVEDKTRSNIKISHPFFTILSDQLSAYMLSFKENPIRAKEKVEGLQEHLDTYFDEDFWAEIGDLISGAYNKGFEYLYAYKNEDDRLAFECADSMGVVEVRAKDTDDKCEYIIYWYIDRIDKGKKTVKRIQVWSETETHYFVQIENGAIEKDDTVLPNPRPHIVYEDEHGELIGDSLGFIPFWRLDNNKKQFSGLKPIKHIIDDYDLHACSLSNNLKDFDTPLHVVKGFDGHGEEGLNKLQTNLKTKKIVGVDAEGDVEVRTVDIPYQARKEKLELDKEGIFTFGMGFDPTKVGDGNITNVVIKSRYTLLDLKANALEKRLKKLLKKIIKVVLDEINTVNDTDYQLKDVKFDFERSITTNETENIQNAKIEAETKQLEVNTILNIAANVGDEQTLKALCDVMDWDFDELQGEIEKIQEENNLNNAKKTLETVIPEDEPIIEEPVEE